MKNVIKNKKFIAIILVIIIFFSSAIAYAYNSYSSQNTGTVSFFDAIELTSNDMTTSRSGISLLSDVNVDNSGGDSNYSNNTGTGYSIQENERDEGVRATLVDAETGKVITRPIDFANNPMPATRWFGAICKFSYLGIGNTKVSLSSSTSSYSYKKPDNPLPKIVNGDLQAIKNYFGSEKFLNYFSSLTGVSYENLTSGKYKLILEPVGYPKIDGVYYACTATELALFDELLSGTIRKYLVDFSHKDLPLSMFLATEDFGIYPYTGGNERQSNTTIINKLGIGIVSFDEIEEEEEEEEIEIIVPEYTYRTGTEVYTALNTIPTNRVLEGSSSKGYSIYPTTVTFSLSDSSDGAKIISTKDTAYKSNDTVYVKWLTPNVEKNMYVIANIKYYTSVTDEKTGESKDMYVNEEVKIPVAIKVINENTPPNPVADDKNNSFKYSTISSSLEKNDTSNSWNEYDLEIDYVDYYTGDGEYSHTKYYPLWTTKTYKVELETNVLVTPDPLCKTYTYENGYYTMKSGYGVRLDLTGKLVIETTTEREYLDADNKKQTETTTTYTDTDLIVPAQNGVAFFSDFGYKTYWRNLAVSDTNTSTKSTSSTFSFKNNPYSTYNNPTHFTPIWYPDDTNYTVLCYLFDIWTPAGMLYSTSWDSVMIDGNLWDDWYVQLLPADY